VAGDWIKLEKCSPNKPEIMRLARLWGMSQDAAFGAVARFWIWIDDACVDGLVDGVASHEVDAMMHFAGFAQGLVAVGWLEIDDTKPSLRIPNFAKHNTETSKKRALKNDRQARWRAKHVDAHVDATPSTREEKKREEKITTKEREQGTVANAPSTAVSVHGTRLDPIWTLPIDWLEWTKGERPDFNTADVERIALVFRDHWHSKPGKDGRKQDWFATWRNWIRREQRHYSTRPESLTEKRARNMDILTGKVRDERVVQGTTQRVDRAVVLSLPSGLREPDGHDVEGRGPERSASGMG
jgi:hypothetical protein